jgi:hypothetical protein
VWPHASSSTSEGSVALLEVVARSIGFGPRRPPVEGVVAVLDLLDDDGTERTRAMGRDGCQAVAVIVDEG